MERILVFEFASGCCSNIGDSVLVEGFSMLKLVAEGLKTSGYYTIVALGSGIMRWNSRIDVDEIIRINPDYSEKNITGKILEIAGKHGINFVFPIAPDNKLAEIAKFLNSHGVPYIAPEPDSVEISADKWRTYLNLKNAGIPTPETMQIEKNTGISEIESNFGYPLIIKKMDGISCEGLYKVRNRKELENILNIINKEKQNFIAQKFIEGTDASVTVFSNGRNSVAVSLNRQDIRLSAHGSEYMGGEVPFNHPQKKSAFRIAEYAVNAISGLKGAIGVDVVLSDRPYIIEINPRITTSMIGLELASGMNIGDWALKSYLGELPEIPEFSKKIRFSKYFSTRNIKSNEIHEFKNLFAGPVSYSGEIRKGECAGILIEEIL